MKKYAVLQTTKGEIKFELFTEKAPITTSNFIGLANKKFYDGLTFHRVIPGFVAQGGDPEGDGTGGSGKHINLEIVPGLKHVKGAVAMARSSEPDSASSQFYITLDKVPHLDGSYAVFGLVTKGMENVLKLQIGDRMNTVRIIEE